MPIHPRRSFSLSITASPRPALARLFAIATFVGCVMLVISDAPIKRMAAGAIIDAATPVMAAINSPVQLVSNVAADTKSLFMMHQENIALKAENEELRKWQLLANRLDAENNSLRLLLGASSRLEHHYLAARVIHEGIGLNSQSGLIDIGSEAGIRRGLAAITYDGVVGRITDVGGRSARLLYITSTISNIPVVTGDSAEAGILSGRGATSLPVLRYANHSDIKAGEKITTSGAGGMLPPGLPVGVVEKIEADGTVLVRPLAKISALDYVTIIEAPAVVKPADGQAAK